MKKRIVFLISCLLDGGIDTALIEYLRGIDYDRYEVVLGIGMKMEGLEVHLGRVPRQVKVEYLVDEPGLVSLRRRKQIGGLPGGLKLYDELFLNPVRRLVSRRRLRKLTAGADLVVDFDATFYTPLQGCAAPVVGFYHFSIEENLRRSERHTRRQMAGMASYDRIALVSDIMVEEGKKLFPELAPKFVRIYNGYNLEEFRKRSFNNPGIPLPGSYFVAVERLEESQKDLTSLIKAYSRAFREYSTSGEYSNALGEYSNAAIERENEVGGNAEVSGKERSHFPFLVIVGEGKDRKELERLAVEQNVADRVIFTGFQKEVPAIMRGAVGLIHSSKYEGFGLVLAESLILGKPVISTDTPTGPAEVLDGGKAGKLVAVGDVEGLAQCMRRLATDEDWRADLSRKAERRGNLFDIRASLKALFSIL